MPLRGAFVSEPRVRILETKKADEESGEWLQGFSLVVEGYARRDKAQVR